MRRSSGSRRHIRRCHSAHPLSNSTCPVLSVLLPPSRRFWDRFTWSGLRDLNDRSGKEARERRCSVATIVSMPKWGLAMKTGLVVAWLKHRGDAVQQGEPVVEIESEKATNEVEAPVTGFLRWLEVAEGQHAPVGAALSVIVTPGADLSDEQVTTLIREDSDIKRQKAEALNKQPAAGKTAGAPDHLPTPPPLSPRGPAHAPPPPPRPAHEP